MIFPTFHPKLINLPRATPWLPAIGLAEGLSAQLPRPCREALRRLIRVATLWQPAGRRLALRESTFRLHSVSSVSSVVNPNTNQTNTMSAQEKSELTALRAELAALKAKKAASVKLKVSEKGAVSVYGLGRFPVTLYKEQMETLLEKAEEIRSFIAANAFALKTKEA